MNMKEYEGWIGSNQYFTKATNVEDAKRQIAHQHRNRYSYWDKSIASIMRQVEIKKGG
jgi:hypothetical protein